MPATTGQSNAGSQGSDIQDDPQLEDKKANGQSSGVQSDSQLQDIKDNGQVSEIKDGSQPCDMNVESLVLRFQAVPSFRI